MSKWFEKSEPVRRAMDTAGGYLTDRQASEAVALYPKMKYEGALIAVGTRINWNGTIKRNRVDLWDTEINNPANAPDLWETVMYRDGYRVIPYEITAENPFAYGERGWWGDILYESVYSGANVWTPDAYPEGWKVVEQ